MRASFALTVAVAVAAYATPCLAQAPEHPQAAPSAPAASAAKAPKAAPKAQQNATETGHIDALSPDEARRIQRIRDKAAGKSRPETPSQAARPPVAGSATTRAASEPPAPGASRRAASSPQTTPKAAGTREPPSTAAASPPAQKLRASREARSSERRDDAARSPRHAARQHQDISPREAMVPRRARQRLDASAMRRSPGRFAERRTPRVGDVVPPGVPLYPLPPGYGPQRGYPPFPRSRDQAEDDGAPPRY